MTANEFVVFLNYTYGIGKDWPHTLAVDAETYANCCQEVFNQRAHALEVHFEEKPFPLYSTIPLGINNGLMFKGIELLLR